MVTIKVGCCGWAEAHQNYYKNFKVLEVQETFYQPGNLSKYEKWRKEAPKDFEFILKAWQVITHPSDSPTYQRLRKKILESEKKNYGFFKSSKEVFQAWGKIDKIAQLLNTKIILFQCPASFKPIPEHKENLKKFFQKIDRREYIFVWEPRGKWKGDEIKKLCKELDLVHCVDPFKNKSTFGKINYFRLHGRPGYSLYYKYTDRDLKQLKNFCDRKINYILFNNLSMLRDAKRFQKLL